MKLILLELNEINFNFVRKYISSGKKLKGFKKLFEESLISTKSEDDYELLEPWIQWVSVHTGKSYKEHKVYRLGDMALSSEKQIFETLEDNGFKVGAVSPMNTRNNLKNPSYFIPDPWTKTHTDGSYLSNFVHYSLSQAVNDNSQNKLTLKTILFFIISMLIAISLKDLLSLFKYALSCIKFKHRKALFLDSVIFKIHQYLFKKNNPDFSVLFLNGGAHIQHHYFFNSREYINAKNKNPSWYLKENFDPVLDMLNCYDNFILELLNMKDVEIIIATGLSQKPYDRTKFYYRLKNHQKFLNMMKINFDAVFPRMTRDFLVTFKTIEEAKSAEDKFLSVKVNNTKGLFEYVDNRGKELFVTLTYPEELSKNDIININTEEQISVKDHLVFVAIKNGMHQGEGFAYFSEGIKKLAPANGDHVKEIYTTILKFFGISIL